jgi:hypothetical protein
MASESGRAVPAAAIKVLVLAHSIVVKLLACLPAGTRVRCTTVCLASCDKLLSCFPADVRAFCATLFPASCASATERTMCTRVDLSRRGGATYKVDDAALATVTAHAGGQLEALDLSDCQEIPHAALLRLVVANAGTLRELWFSGRRFDLMMTDNAELEELLCAAPQLQILEADVTADLASARQLLRNEPPFGVVRMVGLLVKCYDADESAMVSLAADVAVCLSLRRLCLLGVRETALAALDAVVDAALVRRLSEISFSYCSLSSASVPALARSLGGGLTSFRIRGSGTLLHDPAAVLQLSVALRNSSVLTALSLHDMKLWEGDAGTASLLLGVLIAHPSLRQLDVSWSSVSEENQAAAGCNLAALIAANATALQVLDVSHCSLGDEGMGRVR